MMRYRPVEVVAPRHDLRGSFPLHPHVLGDATQAASDPAPTSAPSKLNEISTLLGILSTAASLWRGIK